MMFSTDIPQKNKIELYRNAILHTLYSETEEPEEYKEKGIKGFRSLIRQNKLGFRLITKELLDIALDEKDLFIVDDLQGKNKKAIHNYTKGIIDGWFLSDATATCINKKQYLIMLNFAGFSNCENSIIVRFPLESITFNTKRGFINVLSLIHELIHHKEWINNTVLDPDGNGLNDWYISKRNPYLERNTYFIEDILKELFLSSSSKKSLVEIEKILGLGKSNKKDKLAALNELLKKTKTILELENGSSTKFLGAKHKPDLFQLKRFIGFDFNFKNILEYYKTGACGTILQEASYLLLEKFYYQPLAVLKALENAEKYCKLHKMNEQEAEEHLKMIKNRLEDEKKEFEKMWKFQWDNIVIDK